jgi:hypothetical protein
LLSQPSATALENDKIWIPRLTMNLINQFHSDEMMATTSSKTIRIRNIAADIAEDQFNSNCLRLNNPDSEKKSKAFWKRHKAASSQSLTAALKTSRARQNDNDIATVTLETSAAKAKALKISPTPDHWILDDVFNGVTMLASPVDAEIEYV